ncbi:MAG: hypothetical protein U0736_09330 [Gemmataceae bacterium]
MVDAAGGLAGVFSERDLLVKVAGYHPDYADRPVVDFMTRRPETIRETDSLALCPAQDGLRATTATCRCCRTAGWSA